ncbi:MAG: hypothetical protein IPK59_03975 [Rhodospirillaceae bacterium]|nr:hypothetical protein [Rhodospirillaceae bacterium]
MLQMLSPTAQSTVVAGGTAYLSLAPNLTALTMYRFHLDTLPPAVADAAASVITTGWTGIAMVAVGLFSLGMSRLNAARGS